MPASPARRPSATATSRPTSSTTPSPRNRRPALGRCNYEQLKSGSVAHQRPPGPQRSPGPAFSKASPVARTLKQLDRTRRIPFERAGGAPRRQGAATPLAMKPPAAAAANCFTGAAGSDSPRRRHAASPGTRQLCFSCGQCLGICPLGVFRRDDGWRVTAEPDACTGCGRCRQVCPVGAIAGGQNE